nr:isoquinoline 1-oxidoreductase subunit alpha-like [Nerophis lumbriciformis]
MVGPSVAPPAETTMINITVNGQAHEVDVDPATPILWVLREQLGLVGTKFGCGVAQCGACTVHLGGTPIRSCSVPVSVAVGQSIETIESVTGDDGRRHQLQQAWIDEQVPQCGYCQSGQIMSALALLKTNPQPDDAAIDSAMGGNICRCGTYPRIRRAIHRAALAIAQTSPATQDLEDSTAEENV